MDVDPLLEAFTRKLMAKRPDERFASAAAARSLLDLIASDPKAAARELATATLPRTTEPAFAVECRLVLDETECGQHVA